MHAYRYGVVNLSRKSEFESCEPPERFVEMAEKFHRLFGVESLNYEIWQNEGTWIPLHGVPFAQTALLPDVLDTLANKSKKADVVGKKILNNYRRWQREIRNIQRYRARRESDPSRLEILEGNTKKVQWLVSLAKDKEFQDIDVVRIFDRMIENGQKLSYQSLARKMSISVATLYRVEKRLTKALGESAIHEMTHKELDELLRE
ncbi:hypothetical protein LLE49_26760 [Alicyclobacillus tolerans]|uniref:helix-turn-helix domain-containing protein n=1 Tax=Alicyclobacillus tolerans TaxID=90970 RepID=UPI001F3B6271|nr:helix-turn-helix domain-containing protein [Alicyclobacillus tolerans]MCF8568328.1 hypothetical protein [Alicyclobacillus tolerans]